MYPHPIRLRGPWRVEALEEAPARARFLRRFGYPGRIDPHERVWLTLANVSGPSRVSLNGRFLGSQVGLDPFEFDITDLLRPRNELLVDVEGADVSGQVGDVALEVRATAFLRDVRVEAGAEQVVAWVEVVGEAEGLLELYFLLDRSTVAYEQIRDLAGPLSVRLAGPRKTATGETARSGTIELVHGAVRWYTVQIELGDHFAQGSGA